MAEVKDAARALKEGDFELVELSPGRWSMWNEHTRTGHVTYGTCEEVRERARRQTSAWKRKIAASKGVGAAWRGRAKL